MIETDYLIVGAGATGMIFADEMLTHSDARIVIVDRRIRPGGHWNDAYPFVRLHQPSAFYGAGSRELGSRRIETRGPNAGLYQQASGAEISAYFEQLMQERLLPSGRVRFLPLHEYRGEGSGSHRVASLVTGEVQDVRVKSKLVDTTFYRISTPKTHTRNYEVGEDAHVIPPNDLPEFLAPHRNYVVVGGGKTSMDVLIWLQEQGVGSDALTWIVPRDSWLINRETIQPGDAGMVRMVEGLANALEAAAHGLSLDDIYDRLERSGDMLRVDPGVRPRMFHQATISRGELEVLRRVEHVIRARHVRRIERKVIVFEDGAISAPRNALYIDCTARAINFRPTRPVFDGSRITLQFIRDGRISLSAAAIGFVEATFADERKKNRLCAPIPYEEHLIAWPRAVLAELKNGESWAKEPAIRAWARKHRLAGFTSGGSKGEQLARLRERIALLRPRAVANLERLVAEYDRGDGSPSVHDRPAPLPLAVGGA
ncbi:MAG: NAD(P)/FAD-dependent oxidoreductase [Lysobacterales bacterium]|jgi:hypothetical protein